MDFYHNINGKKGQEMQYNYSNYPYQKNQLYNHCINDEYEDNDLLVEDADQVISDKSFQSNCFSIEDYAENHIQNEYDSRGKIYKSKSQKKQKKEEDNLGNSASAPKTGSSCPHDHANRGAIVAQAISSITNYNSNNENNNNNNNKRYSFSQLIKDAENFHSGMSQEYEENYCLDLDNIIDLEHTQNNNNNLNNNQPNQNVHKSDPILVIDHRQSHQSYSSNSQSISKDNLNQKRTFSRIEKENTHPNINNQMNIMSMNSNIKLINKQPQINIHSQQQQQNQVQQQQSYQFQQQQQHNHQYNYNNHINNNQHINQNNQNTKDIQYRKSNNNYHNHNNNKENSDDKKSIFNTRKSAHIQIKQNSYSKKIQKDYEKYQYKTHKQNTYNETIHIQNFLRKNNSNNSSNTNSSNNNNSNNNRNDSDKYKFYDEIDLDKFKNN